MMTVRTPAILSASAALIGVLACSGLSGQPASPSEGGEGEPFALEDDFSYPSSGWQMKRDPGGILDYEDGAYRVALDQEQWTYLLGSAVAGLDVADVVVMAEVRYVSNETEAAAGVLCRRLDGDNFHYFVIRDGAASISGFVDGEQIALVDDLAVAGIDPENLRVRGECIGESLTFYVNGRQAGRRIPPPDPRRRRRDCRRRRAGRDRRTVRQLLRPFALTPAASEPAIPIRRLSSSRPRA